jgi:hypothetical protein
MREVSKVKIMKLNHWKIELQKVRQWPIKYHYKGVQL